jgi:tRNA-splicing ligase RtcB
MTDTFDAGRFTLHKVRDYVWEIPKEGDMRVPARVLASRALLEEISDDKTLQQLQNTTHLPGIQKHALCMPDGHQGYGFPVGGVAGIETETGCISPGAVGYDINCLTGDSAVQLEFGRRISLGALRNRFENERAFVASDNGAHSSIRLFVESGSKPVYSVETETGETIEATTDHPFATPDGMVRLAELTPGDSVRLRPFRGVEHENPEQFTLLTEADFDDSDSELVTTLTQNDILPLQSTDDAFQRLLKLVGFATGLSHSDESRTVFYADPEDLDSISQDVSSLGFTPSRIHAKQANHDSECSRSQATQAVTGLRVKGLNQLLTKLGAPEGFSDEFSANLPDYFDRLADWQRALYLSTLFGAQMSGVAAQNQETILCPTISRSSDECAADKGEQFFHLIADALHSLGIKTTQIERTGTASCESDGRLQLSVSQDPPNLIRFLEMVGYRYCMEKSRHAAMTIQYLRIKERATRDTRPTSMSTEVAADGGVSMNPSTDPCDTTGVSIGRPSRSRQDDIQHRLADFPTFDEFAADATVYDDATVDCRITDISRTGQKIVYDIGVVHDAHNFVANGFVVSNCGVRMMKTNLRYDDIKGTEQTLVDRLFEAIPSGLGGGGIVQGGNAVEEVLEQGMDWALDEGWAVASDLTHCEDQGRRPDAAPDAVSQKATDRGRNQLGSLGSGNHFLEVQRVTDVFDDDIGAAFGLRRDQIVVLIHCGSRGLGHQVCTDYLRQIEKNHSGLLSQLPDKELAAAPAGSQLAQEYYGAMCAAINFAWVNRQLIMHQTRQVFEDVFETTWEAMEMDLLYDVAHNIAKKEVHEVDGAKRELFVHRKGATRAFPAGRQEVPKPYRGVGQPVIIPGSMGTGSYVLCGGADSMALTFGSTAHGAGRLMSRTQAKQEYRGDDVQDDLRTQEVYVKAQSGATIAEEAPGVYKDVDEVVRVSDKLGIGSRVARTFPVCNIKG